MAVLELWTLRLEGREWPPKDHVSSRCRNRQQPQAAEPTTNLLLLYNILVVSLAAAVTAVNLLRCWFVNLGWASTFFLDQNDINS